MVSVKVALLPGDHYMIEEDIGDTAGMQDIPTVDTHNPRNIPPFKLIVASSDSTVVNVYVKIGQDFTVEVPPNFILENIIFDFADSVIDKSEDPGNCRTTRSR